MNDHSRIYLSSFPNVIFLKKKLLVVPSSQEDTCADNSDIVFQTDLSNLVCTTQLETFPFRDDFSVYEPVNVTIFGKTADGYDGNNQYEFALQMKVAAGRYHFLILL